MSSENENCLPPPLNVDKCSLVLVDVAGTTTSIDFVKDTLFSFVAERAEAFLGSKWGEDSVKECLKQIRENDDGEWDVAKAVEMVKKLTEENSQNKGLKTLQGLIYKEGYEKGDLKAHVFEDVAEAFKTWANGRKIAIYSTGSVDSQKLLFAHTISGDLSGHISNYFDQAVGEKTEAESYKKIAEETQLTPEEIVFITDDIKEATAAKSGGLHAVLIKRKGNLELPEEVSKDFVIVSSFTELALDKTSKRKIEEAPPTANAEEPPSKVPKTDSETTDGNVDQESMEVDPQPEKPAAEADQTETATEETEKLVKNTPEKTETEEKADADMKEATEPETTVETVIEVTVEEIPPVAEEKQPAAEKTDDAAKEPEKVAAKDETVAAEESKSVQLTVDKVETPVKPSVTKETEDKSEEKPSAEEKKAQPAAAAEVVVEKTEPEERETEKTESKPDEKKTTSSEEKPGEVLKNGEEPAETSAPKTEEKENKSVLANGVENGSKDQNEVDNNATEEKGSETAEVTNDDVDNKDDETEVKVKKLEESAESKTVSVEV